MSLISQEMFDIQGQTSIKERSAELELYHEEYLKAHPELQQVLHEFMQALLFHKPADALAFMQEYFAKHREKSEPYLAP